MKLLIIDGNVSNFKTYRDLFKHLANDNCFVEKVENGKLHLMKQDEEIIADFGELNVEDSINPFNDEIVEYRKELRTAMESLKDLGIDLEPAQTEKLRETFSFLN